MQTTVFDFMEMKRSAEVFRFSSRRQYEEELSKLISVKKFKQEADHEKQYEELMEEYLRFSAQDDG